jgi:hypothetical protein
MQIYHFDRETGEFQHQSPTRLDPLTQLPVLPAHSTSAPPPVTAEGEAAVWDGGTGQWTIVEDHRGQTVYVGWESAGVVDYLGPIRDGYSLSQADKPQSVLDAERARIIQTELRALDLAAVRPLRAHIAGTSTDEDMEYLVQNESAVQALRAELATLQPQE